MRGQKDGTSRAAHYIYMPFQCIYAIGIQYDRAARLGEYCFYNARYPLAPSETAADQARIAAF